MSLRVTMTAPGVKTDLLYRFSSLQLYASGFAGVAMGIARGTLDSFVELARDKVPFRGKRSLRDNNVVQSQVAQAEARLRSARAFLLGSLEDITAEVERVGRITLDQRMTIRLASTFAIHQSLAVVDTAYHAAGSTAIFEENRSSGASATSTRCRNNCRDGRSTSRLSASTCSASNPTTWPGCESPLGYRLRR